MARRRRKSARRSARRSARYNPFFLGKKTALGSSLSGRLLRRKKRPSKKALSTWRKKNVRGKRRVKSLVAGEAKLPFLNPWFLGKKTALGSPITGRVVRSKSKRRRIGKKALLTWRKKHVKGRYVVKGGKRVRKNPSYANPRQNKGLSARLARLERKIKALSKRLTKATSHRRLGSGR